MKSRTNLVSSFQNSDDFDAFPDHDVAVGVARQDLSRQRESRAETSTDVFVKRLQKPLIYSLKWIDNLLSFLSSNTLDFELDCKIPLA